jgi:hypothetical protein
MARWSGKSLAFPALLVALAVGVYLALAAFMGKLEQRAVANPAVREHLIGRHARPLADVAQTIASLNLVTAEVRTRVVTSITHENWRGPASATVEAPVRLLYGVDVSQVRSESIAFSPASRAYLVRIPPPQRIATEVLGGDETIDVQVGWARLRSRAGEYYLGLARKSLHDRAQELVLGAEDAANVRQMTIAQVQSAVQKLVGDAASVTVVIEDRLDSPRSITTATGGAP